MSSTMDPSKLKVVDLRNELTARGLDSKGNKAVLVKRLQDALDEEAKGTRQPPPKTDIQAEEEKSEPPEEEKPDPRRERRRSRQRSIEASSKPETPKPAKILKADPIPEEKLESKSPEKQETKPVATSKSPIAASKSPVAASKSPAAATKSQVKSESKTETASPQKSQPAEKPQTPVKKLGAEVEEVKDKSSAKAEKTQPIESEDVSQNGDAAEEGAATEQDVVEAEPMEDEPQEDANTDDLDSIVIKLGDSPTKDESDRKRKRSTSPNKRSPSSEHVSRRRSRSPIRENEPDIDPDRVLLSWYDSDLQLTIDKESFLSAKPLSEGVFSYVWAGARATHGVCTGKTCYEVKITEELSCEDFVKFQQNERPRTSRNSSHYHRRDRDRKYDRKESHSRKSDEHSKSDNKDSEKEPVVPEETEGKESEKTDTNPELTKESDEKMDSENVNEGTDNEANKDLESSQVEKPVEEETVKDESIVKNEEAMDTATTAENMDTKEQNEADSQNESVDDTSTKKESEGSKADTPKPNMIPLPKFSMRIGWSNIKSRLQLGEEEFSYGYDSTGKFASAKNFVDYGKPFGVGDVIGAYLDIQDEQVIIRYTVNGELQPVATEICRSELPEDFTLFPHIMSHNYSFEVNFGEKEEAWFPAPPELEGYIFISKFEEKLPGPSKPASRADCEIIMMCGLPAVGKTTWVKEHVASSPEKMFNIIGNDSLLERMTVYGQPLKPNFPGRWAFLIDRLQRSLNTLSWMAASRRRNYIIDQTNVFPTAQRRKVRPFEGFQRRAVVVIVEDEEYTKRQALQEERDGNDVPESTIFEMKAGMAIPEKCEWLDDITFVGLTEEEAKEKVKKYNSDAKEAGYGLEKRFKSSGYGRRGGRDHRRHDGRGYHGKGYDRYKPRYSGWERDRYGHRSPPRRNYRDDYHDRSRRYSMPHGGRNYVRNQSNYRDSPRGGGNRPVWASGGNWNQGGDRGGWNQQSYRNSGSNYAPWANNSGGGQKWGYQGQGYGGYNQNWNYNNYGQYGQSGNWNQK